MTTNTFQAFPIRKNTYIGTATDVSAKGYNVIHLNADGTITLSFGGTNVSVDGVAGNDFVISGADTITTTAQIIMS